MRVGTEGGKNKNATDLRAASKSSMFTASSLLSLAPSFSKNTLSTEVLTLRSIASRRARLHIKEMSAPESPFVRVVQRLFR